MEPLTTVICMCMFSINYGWYTMVFYEIKNQTIPSMVILSTDQDNNAVVIKEQLNYQLTSYHVLNLRRSWTVSTFRMFLFVGWWLQR